MISTNSNLSISSSISDILTLSNEPYSNLRIIAEINTTVNSFSISSPFLSPYLNSSFPSSNFLSRLWKASPKAEMTPLHRGDIIKLGRVRLKIDRIIMNDRQSNNNYNLSITNLHSSINNTIGISNNDNINRSNYNNSNCAGNTITNVNNSYNVDDDAVKTVQGVEQNRYCRICYCGETDIGDPLLSPCRCNGSMRLIHYSCLKQCIESRMTRKDEEYYTIMTWKGFECEICKEKYPKYFKCKDELYPLVDMHIPFSEYVLCDYSMYDDTQKRTIKKGVLAINITTKGKEISIGRTTSNNIKLKDISVSRMHCALLRKDKDLYIIDKGSKFGTMLYMNREMQINEKNRSAMIISGKYFIDIRIEDNRSFLWGLLKCCEAKSNNDNDFVVDKEEECSKSNTKKILDLSYEDYIMEVNNFCKDAVNI